jgi:hypothetical protein
MKSRMPPFATIWTVIWAAFFAVVVSISIYLCDGHLIYTLDDPYIHLAVAENIARGGYGVNAQEFSSPSSSILFPFLLTPFVTLGLGRIGPLIINTLTTAFSVWLLLDFYWKRAVEPSQSRFFPNCFSALLILAINALALPMTGMEHSLHVLAVILTVRGLVELAETGKISTWLICAVICMPFIRFEGLAFAGAAILAIGLSGHWRAAILMSVMIVAGLTVYGLTMHRLGLPLLPSSVLVKSNLTQSIGGGSAWVGIITGLVGNFLTSLNDRWGIVFALTICITLFASQESGRWRSVKSPEFLVGGAMVLALAAHFVAGRYGWFHRYEVYAVAIMVCSGVYLMRSTFLNSGNLNLLQQKAVLAAFAFIIFPYLGAAGLTPLASRAIYDQQFQMHRFATEFFPRTVAVNDLGWVSYENEAFVLDLWGLGSEKMRKLRVSGLLNAETVAKMANDANADYAMIYDAWFPDAIPGSWCLMAILQTDKIASASAQVSFYAIKLSARADLNDALNRFAPTLPVRDTLTRKSCG